MSQVPCANCGRLTTGRSEDRVSGRIIALCEKCNESSSSRMWFMLLALTAAIVCLMQNV
ncbi:MAG: hypothetical protein JXB13_14625 [Phycisphaerae bacterium]|nr:hypothetical protein [Phycisphaerae bacterium]